VIAGGKRFIATEPDMYSALKAAEQLGRELVAPHFRRTNEFTQHLFNGLYNLSFAYVDAIVSSVAEEYIPEDKSIDAKCSAMGLARQAERITRSYRQNGLDEKTRDLFTGLNGPFSELNPEFMRSWATVPVTRKKIAKGGEYIERIAEEVTIPTSTPGRFEYEPTVIFPIAQGGTELAVRIANDYEDKGLDPLVYPLLYSVKTKKQKYPWIKNDSQFLGRNLEGKNLLVTEDWVTTGNTLRGILIQLEQLYPQEIRVATIKRDPDQSRVQFLDRYQFYIGQHLAYTGDKKEDSLAPRDSQVSLKDIASLE
jgi:hypothetical protein